MAATENTLFVPAESLAIVPAHYEAESMVIEEWLKEPVVIEKVTYDADMTINTQELEYLTGISRGTILDAAILKKALFYLILKNKFSVITISLTPGIRGAHFAWHFTGMWTFAKLVLRGFMLGKEAYRQYYLLEPGDFFDKEKHQLSLVKIYEAFHEKGYFNVHIKSLLLYDNAGKNVTAELTFNRGNRFVINEVTIQLAGDCITPHDDVFLREKINEYFTAKVLKKEYSTHLLNTQVGLLKNYLATKGFIDVTMQMHTQIKNKKHAVALTLSVEVNNKKRLAFFGNTFFSSKQLLNQILQFGQSALLVPASLLCQELLDYYYAHGFYQAVLEVQENEEKYLFVVQEGVRSAITKLIVHGVMSFDPAVLISKYGSTIIKKEYYDQAAIKKMTDDLIAFYLSQGFWDAKIVNTSFEITDPLTAQGALIITIQEGEQNYVHEVIIDEPFSSLKESGPCALDTSKGPIAFSTQLLQEQRDWLIATISKQGYYHVQAKPEYIKKANGIGCLIWHIVTNKQLPQFGKTVIRGSKPLFYMPIMRELVFKDGDAWNQAALVASRERIASLELFDSLSLTPLSDVREYHERPIIVKAYQDDPFELRLRGGFGFQHLSKRLFIIQSLTYKVGGLFMIKNPFDKADLFKIDASFVRGERSVIAQYKLPWLGNLPVRTLFQVHTTKYKQPAFINHQRNLYDLFQHGFLVGFSKQYGFLQTAINLGVDVMKTTVSEANDYPESFSLNVARAINFEPTLLDKNIPFAVCEPICIIDRTDNRVNPTQGTLSLLSLKGMLPLYHYHHQDPYFVKVIAQHAWYVPISPCIVAFRLRIGHIFHRHVSSIMPSERFYLGGANSIRSYETDRCPPLGNLEPENENGCFVPQGGKSMFNGNIELRIPVYKGLGITIFNDFGALSSSSLADVKPNEIMGGTGLGVRYNTPIGPLRFDIAIKWRRDNPEISRYCWFLTFGNAF